MGIQSLYKSFKSIDLKEEALKAIDRTKEVAVQLNREQIYYSSMRSDGTFLQAYQSEVYAEYKNIRNPSLGFGSPDLYDTGSFQKRFFAVIKGEKLVFDSKDEKTPKLVRKYGENIFGLTQGNIDKYATEAVRKEMLGVVKRITGL